MADFDITTIHGKSSFLASMKKRKAFGLLDSDSEDEGFTPKKSNTNKAALNDSTNSGSKETADKNAESSKPTTEATEKEPVKPKNPYLNNGYDLDFIKAVSALPTPKPKPVEVKKPAFLKEQSASVIELYDDDDLYKGNKDAKIEGLDPELEALMNSTLSRRNIEPQKISVKLQYVQNFENVSEKARPILEKLLKPIKLIIMDNTQFQKILEVFCSHKKLKKSEIVLIYKNDRLFLSGTPGGVGMSPTTTNTIEVYTEQYYATVLREKEEKKQERLRRWAQTKETEEEDTFDPAKFETIDNEPTSEENDDKMFIKLRGSDNKDIVLRVKSTSTVVSIIQKYKEITGIQANIKLSFEGEDLDPNTTVCDAELEDEDLVEVHTL